MHTAGAPPADPVKGHGSYLALVLPGGWLLLWVSALADLAGKQPFTTIWFAFGALPCLAAIAVIVGRGSRRVWVWSIGAIPASFLGPLAFALLFVPAIRHDLRAARLPRPRFQPEMPAVRAWGTEEARRPEATIVRTSGIEEARRPEATTRPIPLRREPYRGPPASVLRLVGWLALCVVGCAAIFLGLLTVAVLGGVHKFTEHQGHVLILLSAVPAAGAILIVSWEWMLKGVKLRRRAAVAFPAALIAQAVVWGAAAWWWVQNWS
jgi:hypothetical protein